MLDSISPEFFDIFGALAFAFFIILAIWALKTRKSLPVWVSVVILAIGVAGLSVDIFNVCKFYFKLF